MEFLEVLDTIRAEEASVHRLFGDAGQSASNTRRVMEARVGPTKYKENLLATVDLLEGVYSGRKGLWILKEAMSTSDFPLYLGDVLDRQLLGAYQEFPVIWAEYCKRATVPDFRNVKRFAFDGAEGVLPEVLQGVEYTESTLSETRYPYAVKKYGRRLPFLWELIINDDLGAFRDAMPRFGRAARRSEEKFATELHVGSTGPSGTIYTAGNNNIVETGTLNPPLSLDALRLAVNIIMRQTDTDGEPIMVRKLVLEVGPDLEITAESIANAVQIRLNEAGGSTNSQLVTTNWTQNRIKLVMNPYIPVVATTNGATTWFLHAAAGEGRPAFEMGFLRGHESPEMFQKKSNAMALSGGGEALESFETDSVDYKVRHVFGGVALDPRMTFGSNGSGS
jgi:hypothetical protein